MKALTFTTALLSLTPTASAISWPQWLPEPDSLVVRRADTTSTTSEATATQTSSSSATDSVTSTNLNTAGTSTSTSGTASGTSDASGSSSGTGTKTDSSSSGKKTSTSSVSVSSGAAAGSAVMQTPKTTLTSAFYRIGEYVTFGWNYTNVQITPTAIDIVASCSTATQTWTLTSNMTFETTAAFTWDTGAYQSKALQQPLVVEEYTLYIFDADSSISATAGAGSLTPAAAVTFGLYTGQPYTPLSSGWVCATCSGALSHDEARALGFAFTMVGITVLSFTWFVTGLW